jgi:preprotein translocase subunit SecD
MKARDRSLGLLALVLLLSTWSTAAQKPAPDQHKGRVTLEVKAVGSSVTRIIAQTVAVIQKRCRLLRIQCKFQPQANENTNRLTVEFSTRMDHDRVKGILVAAGLELRGVISPRFPEPMLDYPTISQALAAAATENQVYPSPAEGDVMYLVAEDKSFFTGNDVGRCVVLRSEENVGEYEVDCRLRRAGAARLHAWTGANINRYVVVIFNQRVLSAAYIKAPISFNVVVSGGFDKRQAHDAVIILHSGNLHSGVELLEEGISNPPGPVAVNCRHVKR